MNQSVELEVRTVVSPATPEGESDTENKGLGASSDSNSDEIDIDPSKKTSESEINKHISNSNISQSSSQVPPTPAIGKDEPLPNMKRAESEPIPKKQPTPLKIDPPSQHSHILPPMSEHCEHMEYNFSGDFQPFITQKFSVSVNEFHRVLIGSNFWSQVNEVSGYTEPTMTPWIPSNNGNGQTVCCCYRMNGFRMAINGKIGPKSTRVNQTQKCKLKNQNELRVETITVSKDVPYGDNFSVDSLMTITSDGDHACVLKLATKVKFTKSVWGIGGIIEKSALSGNKDFFLLWISMAKSALEKNVSEGDQVIVSISNSTDSNIKRSSLVLPPPSSTGLGELLTPDTTKYSPKLIHPNNTDTSSTIYDSQFSLNKLSPFLKLSQEKLILLLFATTFLTIILFPYTIYLHRRVNGLEHDISEFYNTVSKFENKISFMHMYIDHLKTNRTENIDKHSVNNMKVEFEGLTHLMAFTGALEQKMDDWQIRLASMGDTLAQTQKMVAGITGEIGLFMPRSKPQNIYPHPPPQTDSSSSWFPPLLFTSLFAIVGSFLYFKILNPGVIANLFNS